MKTILQLARGLKPSALWLFAPTVLLAGMVGFSVSGYDPLFFDASAYIAQASQAPTLKQATPEEAGSGDVAAGTPAPAEAAKTAAAPASTAALADGTFTGYAPCGVGNGDGWKPYYVAVTIEVSGGKVARIVEIRGTSKGNGRTLNWDAAENQRYLDWAISGRGSQAGVKSQLDAAIAAGKTPAGIDVVSQATYSSVAIYNAFANALAQSAAKAGKDSGGKADAPATPAPLEVEEASPGSASSSSSSAKPRKVGDDADAPAADAALADGTFTGYAPCGVGNEDEWKPYYVAVTVEIVGGKVARIVGVAGTSTADAGDSKLDWDADENQVYLDWAATGRTRGGVEYRGVVSQLEAAIAQGDAPAGVDAVSGATYSSEAIFRAYYAALQKSAAKAGATLEAPSSSSSSASQGGSGSAGNPSSGGEPEQGESPSSSGSSEDPSKEAGEAPSEDLPLVDGTYRGVALCGVGNEDGWKPYYLVVDIEVADGQVARISDIWGDADGTIDPAYAYDSKENASYLNKAISGTPRKKGVMAQIQAKLDGGSAVEGIDALSGATISSNSILEAYANAVENARAAAAAAAAEASAGADGESGGGAGGAADDGADGGADDGTGGTDGETGGDVDAGTDAGSGSEVDAGADAGV